MTAIVQPTEEPFKTQIGSRGVVFVIDDDPDICSAIGELLEINGWAVEIYSSCETFLETDHIERRGCILLDAIMPGMSGLELLRRLKTSAHRLPAIMITGNGDVRMAVSAMQAGALDFIEKPARSDALLLSIDQASEAMKEKSRLTTLQEGAAARVATLTSRQRQIMDLVLAGHPSKNIAADLGISQRTVENHRAQIMDKMGVTSIPALICLSIAAA